MCALLSLPVFPVAYMKIRRKYRLLHKLPMWLKLQSVIDNNFFNALRYTRGELFCTLRVVAWAVAEPQGSWLSSDAFVAWEQGLPCGHAGGWERHPKQSPTALVQEFMGPERAGVAQRADRNSFFHTGDWEKQCDLWFIGADRTLSIHLGACRFLALLWQVCTPLSRFPPQEKLHSICLTSKYSFVNMCLICPVSLTAICKRGNSFICNITYGVHIHSGIFLPCDKYSSKYCCLLYASEWAEWYGGTEVNQILP